MSDQRIRQGGSTPSSWGLQSYPMCGDLLLWACQGCALGREATKLSLHDLAAKHDVDRMTTSEELCLFGVASTSIEKSNWVQ